MIAEKKVALHLLSGGALSMALSFDSAAHDKVAAAGR